MTDQKPKNKQAAEQRPVELTEEELAQSQGGQAIKLQSVPISNIRYTTGNG